ncbi:MAG TPA: plastocyanin/azurin family copper-binding protein [Anaerolineales bacterium]|nr:plastocyanin/azurin family copper-binding protein [Anaerolineales bacterium]
MFSSKRIYSAFITPLFAIMLAACGSAASNQGTATPVATTVSAAMEPTSAEVQVEINLFNFSEDEITIPAATTVVWVNHDNIEHSVTSGTPENPDGAFDSDFFVKDESFRMVFDTPGEYPYFCRRHNHMRGVIIVTAP